VLGQAPEFGAWFRRCEFWGSVIETHLAGIVYVKGTHARSPKHSIKPNPSVVTSMVERIALGSGSRV
jgi:hypothetical protein